MFWLLEAEALSHSCVTLNNSQLLDFSSFLRKKNTWLNDFSSFFINTTGTNGRELLWISSCAKSLTRGTGALWGESTAVKSSSFQIYTQRTKRQAWNNRWRNETPERKNGRTNTEKRTSKDRPDRQTERTCTDWRTNKELTLN